MTTYVNFTPSANSTFQFSAVLDGQPYNVTVTWNLFGQRWFLNLYDQFGNWVLTCPVIGSMNAAAISTVAYNQNNLLAVVTTANPHGYKIGRVINLTLVGNDPTEYNGMFQCQIINPTQFTYPLTSNPGNALIPGSVFYNTSMIAGVQGPNGPFQSTLVYRTQNNQFEIN